MIGSPRWTSENEDENENKNENEIETETEADDEICALKWCNKSRVQLAFRPQNAHLNRRAIAPVDKKAELQLLLLLVQELSNQVL